MNEITVSLNETESSFVLKYHDYAVRLLSEHGLEESEYYGDMCLLLCRLARRYCAGDAPKTPVQTRIHTEVHRWERASLKVIPNVSLTALVNTPVTVDFCSGFISDALDVAIGKLTYSEQLIIKSLMNEDDYEAVAKELHVSSETVRYIEAKAIRKLRLPSNRKILMDFIEY